MAHTITNNKVKTNVSLSSEAGMGKETLIYTHRFSREELEARRITWEVLAGSFFQEFIFPEDIVLDIGAGDGFFIRNIKAARRIAVDLSPHVLALSNYGIEVVQAPATELKSALQNVVEGEKVDVVFMSNFLEHLPNKRMVLDVFAQCYQVLRAGGRLLILQPNIRYAKADYWNYIDHHIALTENSLREALEISGFRISKIIPKFLPYTAKSRLGLFASGKAARHLVKWYLRLPILWRIFGAQTFIAASID